MKIKASKKIIMAALALLMAVGLAAGSTFAWFSMNNKVTVDGMQVTTKVSSNLLIADGISINHAKVADSEFKSELTQTVKGILEPVSTVDGTAFFYTTDAKATGEKNQPVASDAYITYSSSAVASDATTYGNKFSEDYGVTRSDASVYTDSEADVAVAYVDYIFQLKAINTNESADQDILLTKLDLNYTGDGDRATEHAYRVVLFVDKYNGSSVSGISKKNIYAPETYENWNSSAVSATDNDTTSIVGIYNATGEAKKVATVTHGATEYYQVVVRLYLEGADKTCNNDTFMKLTGDWALDIELQLGAGTAVSALKLG